MDGCPPVLRLREPLFADHVALCSECREKLDALDLLEAPETAEERRALESLPADPRRLLAAARLRAGPGALRLRKPGRFWPAIAVAAACAAAVVLAVVRSPPDPAAVLREMQGATRPLEPALGDLPWAPYQPRRGGADESAFDPPLRKLLEAREQGRPDAERALAILYLLRAGAGDAARADQALAKAGDGPEAQVARGAVLYARGDWIGALDRFARAPTAEGRFDRALALERLGLRDRAVLRFEEVAAAGTRWSPEAAERARLLRQPGPPPSSTRRREVNLKLLAAGTPLQLAEAERQAEGMPDLLALARKLAPGRLAEHARLFSLYTSLRDRAVSGAAEVREVDEFARLPAVSTDPLLWAPALQLAGYAHQVRGDWIASQRYDASLAAACRVRGCAVENEAIALDELSDLAARDGDFPAARRLQARAEALLTSVGFALPLAELHRKRAALLLEQNLVEEAAPAATAAVRELAPFAVDARGQTALGVALEQAARVAAVRGQPFAAAELGEAALEQARAAGNGYLQVDAAGALTHNLAAAGQLTDARARLEAEIARLSAAGHADAVTPLRAFLGEVLLEQGDAAAALAATEPGAAGTWTSSQVRLAVAHARAARALGRSEQSAAELSHALDGLAQALSGADDPPALLAAGDEAVSELSLLARSGDELALPLDRLRAAALGVGPAGAGWSKLLPPGTCVLVLVPAQKVTLEAVVTREGGEVHRLEPGAPVSAGTERCDELWTFAAAPLDRDAGKATGVATSLRRLLAPEPAGPPRTALFVSAQASGDIAGAASALPGAEREKAALRALGAQVTELSAERATPEQALRLAAGQPLLHFAVHGFDGAGGGFLQLAGEGGRLGAREVARARLQPGARVVLSSCEAGAPGPRGLAWGFARAGASVVAAARDKVDDAAAAGWSERFYAALGRGRTFAQAAREAAGPDRAPRFIVVK